MGQRQYCDQQDYQPAADVEPHHEVAAVFAVDEHSGKGQQEERRQGLQRDQQPERDFGVRGLQDVPDHRRGVHAAADHRDEVGHDQQSHSAVL